MMRSSCKTAGLLLAAMMVMGWGSTVEAADDSPQGRVTYTKDVAPIVFQNCVSCHRPGQIGPMSLRTYDETRPWAKGIKKAVAERTMPPWFAEEGHQTYMNDLRMTDAEVETIVRWVSQGAPEGNAADLPALPEFASTGWNIGEPDQSFVAPEFIVTDAMEDHYAWLSVDNPNTEDKWVKAIELQPGFTEGVHHILVFIGAPGASPSQAEADMDLFAKWGPGTNVHYFPEDHGKLLPAKASLLFQMHYHKEPGPSTGGVDQSRMGVLFHEGEVKHPVTTAWILDPTLDIPAGADNYESQSVFRFIDSGVIYNIAPHMHLRGKDVKYIAEYPDGTKETLLHIPEWDFNWQLTYYFAEPKEVPRGTKIRVLAHFDNSSDNPFNPDPSVPVRWGEATTDEMMIGFMDYIYNKRKKFQRTIALPEGIANGAFGGGGPGQRHGESDGDRHGQSGAGRHGGSGENPHGPSGGGR